MFSWSEIINNYYLAIWSYLYFICVIQHIARTRNSSDWVMIMFHHHAIIIRVVFIMFMCGGWWIVESWWIHDIECWALFCFMSLRLGRSNLQSVHENVTYVFFFVTHDTFFVFVEEIEIELCKSFWNDRPENCKSLTFSHRNDSCYLDNWHYSPHLIDRHRTIVHRPFLIFVFHWFFFGPEKLNKTTSIFHYIPQQQHHSIFRRPQH